MLQELVQTFVIQLRILGPNLLSCALPYYRGLLSVMSQVLIDQIFFVMAMVGTMAMTISAVAQASRANMDPFGAFLLAGVASVGGGTLRDILLGALPVFWVKDLSYLLAILPTAGIAILLVKRVKPGTGIRLRLLGYCDGLGLALFCIIGTRKALDLGFDPLVAVLMGGITGIAGGMARDVLCQQTPVVMQRDLYGTCALVGCVFYVSVLHLWPALPELWLTLASMAIVFAMRAYAILAHWSERQIKW